MFHKKKKERESSASKESEDIGPHHNNMNKFIKLLKKKKKERQQRDTQIMNGWQTEAQIKKQTENNTKKKHTSVRGYISNALMENGYHPEWSRHIQKLS